MIDKGTAGAVVIANIIVPAVVDGIVMAVVQGTYRKKFIAGHIASMITTFIFMLIWIDISESFYGAMRQVFKLGPWLNVLWMIVDTILFVCVHLKKADKLDNEKKAPKSTGNGESVFHYTPIGEKEKVKRLCRVCGRSIYSASDTCDSCRRDEEAASGKYVPPVVAASTGTATKRCPSCHCVVDDNSKFCPSCGEALVVKCPECGAALKKNIKFCNMCGHKMTVETEKPTAKNTEKENEDWKPPIHFDD